MVETRKTAVTDIEPLRSILVCICVRNKKIGYSYYLLIKFKNTNLRLCLLKINCNT